MNKLKTHCLKGHPYSGSNLYVTPDGYRRCRACVAIRQNTPERRAQIKAYDSTPKRRAFNEKRQQERGCLKLGINLGDYERMLEDQGGVCKLCQNPESARYRGRIKRLAVDHDHVTGQIRGLLCQSCNLKLRAVDDFAWLEEAIQYVQYRSSKERAA